MFKSLTNALSKRIPVTRPVSMKKVETKFDLIRPVSTRSLIDSLQPAWIPGGETDMLAVHAALVRSPSRTNSQIGRILFFGGSEYNPDNFRNGRIRHTRMYDYRDLTHTPLESPDSDTFCCGHCLIEGSRLLVAGGTARYPPDEVIDQHGSHWIGLRNTTLFDDQRDPVWTPVSPMNKAPITINEGIDGGGGRWYPTLLTLDDGNVLAMSGHPSETDKRHINNTPEIYSPSEDKWILLNELGDRGSLTLQGQYPRLHLLPNGEIFCVTPLFEHQAVSLIYNPKTQEHRFVGGPIPSRDYLGTALVMGHNTTSVLLPLVISRNHKPRILLCGSKIPLLIDLGEETPIWRPTQPRSLEGSPARYNLNAVLLPTGDVFISGGVSTPEKKDEYIRPELYHPETDTWDVLEEDPDKVVRNYHSVALLTQDGRVWTAGSNKDGAHSTGNNEDDVVRPEDLDTHEPRIQIYKPWYCFLPRPIISDCVPGFTYSKGPIDVFSHKLSTPQASRISRIVIIRTGSTTHAFNSDQRLVELQFMAQGGNVLGISPPSSGGFAPPGDYLLFIIDEQGVPSEGRFVWVRKV